MKKIVFVIVMLSLIGSASAKKVWLVNQSGETGKAWFAVLEGKPFDLEVGPHAISSE